MCDFSKVVRGGDFYLFYKYSTFSEVVALPNDALFQNQILQKIPGILNARH
jgi:hypothetical protein